MREPLGSWRRYYLALGIPDVDLILREMVEGFERRGAEVVWGDDVVDMRVPTSWEASV